MRVDDLTVEVRDRTLKRVGQVTPAYLDLKARTKWCGVGEWTVTLPGDHPMVPYLSEPGSGLLVTGPDGVVTHPPTYTDWREEGRNRFVEPIPANDATYPVARFNREFFTDPVANYVRGTVNTTGSSYFNLTTAANRIPVTPGEQVEWSVEGRLGDTATAVMVRIYWLDASGNYISGTWSDGSYFEGKDWGRFGVQAPAIEGAAYSGVYVLMSSSNPLGATLDIRRVYGGAPGGYLDGNMTPAAPDLQRYRWLGAVNASQSVLETRQMTRGSWRETVYGPLWSGPTRTPTRVRNQQNPDGTFTFSGVTDEILLQGARAFPDPTIGDPQLSSQSRTNDTRTGATEALMRQFVAYNVTFDQAPPERVRGLRKYLDLEAVSGGRGITQSKSPRFQNLLELLQEMVAYDPDLGFRVVQVGGKIEFQVLDARDRTAFVRFDVENGTIVSEEVQTGGPVVTDAIVAGQGEGKARTIVQRRTPEAIAAEEEWGVVFEEFIDQRDTDDLGELQQSGDEALAEGQGGTAVKMVPSDDTTMQVNVDWRQGDVVTTVVSGAETVARVTEVAYSVTSSGVMAGAALGDVSGFTAKDAESSKVQSIDSRVSNLERASAGPVDWARIINEPTAFPTTWDTVSEKPTTFPPSSHTHPWSQVTGAPVTVIGDVDAAALPSSFITGVTVATAGAGFPASIGTVMNVRHSAFRQFQYLYDRSAAARVWFRTSNGDTEWQAWREIITDASLVPEPFSLARTADVNAITSTSVFGQVVSGMSTNIVVPAGRALWVTITFGAWVTATAGETRAGIRLSGATVLEPQDGITGSTSWGQTLYASASDGSGTFQQSMTKTVKLLAGTTTIEARAYQAGGGTHQVNYPVIDVIPQRWA